MLVELGGHECRGPQLADVAWKQRAQATFRRQVGSGLARGWLDARMQNLGWARVRLDGHARPGRDRVGNPHARTHVYRGLLPHDPSGEGGERLP